MSTVDHPGLAADPRESPLEFETPIFDLSSRFISLPPDEVDREIEDGLRRVCEPLGIDIAILWQWAAATPGLITATHAYYAAEELRPAEVLRQELFPWIAGQIRAGRTVVIPRVEEMPAEASVDLEHARQFRVQSSLCLPLSAGGEPPVGALALSTVRTQRDWPDALVQRLTLVGQVFTHALARKRADDALRESEERSRATFEQAAVGIAHVGTDGRWLRVNDRLCAIVGYPREELLQLTFQDITYPDDLEADLGCMRQVLSGEIKTYSMEKRYVRKDRSLVWINLSVSLVRTSSGEPKHFIAVIEDFTERKRSEEALRRSEARLQTGAALAGLAFYEVDFGERMAFVDDRFRDISGIPPERDRGLGPVEYMAEHVHPDDRLRFLDLRRQLREGTLEQASMEYRFLHPTRGERWIQHLALVGARDATGQAVRTFGALCDVTQRKRAEDALRVSEARLAASVELAGLGFFEVDFGAGTLFADDRFRELCGVPHEREGLQILEFWRQHLHPEDAPHVLDARQKAVDGKLEQLSVEYRFLHPARGEVWIQHIGRPAARDAGGRTVRAFGVLRDITDRKRREEALRQSLVEIEQLKDRLQAESDYLKAEISVAIAPGQVTGRSAAIQKVLRQVRQVASTDTAVLVLGETGTGKELVAQQIHRLSPRHRNVMVKVNCAALPAGLVESELFGREKGAFTGALTRQVGRFELADGSTLFLDEIGELSLDLQAKLLRVLETGEFERLGSPRTIKVNVRLIAATNRDLAEAIRQERFRQDLYYRLNVFPIHLPPLRERTEDIPPLVWTFLGELNTRMGKKITQVPRKTMDALQHHPWPGNVRELRNVIEHGVIVTTGDTLRIPVHDESTHVAAAPHTLAEAERDLIIRALERTGWRVSGPNGAAAALGLNPSTLRSRMKKLGVQPPRSTDTGAD